MNLRNTILFGEANCFVATKYLDDRVIKKDTLLKNEYVYARIDAASVQQQKAGNNHYPLLTARQTFKGQAITEKTINFILLDVNSLEHFTLVYEGISSIRCYECIDGNYQPAPILDAKQGLKAVLLEYANKSKWVYRPATQAEKDARHFSPMNKNGTRITGRIITWQTDIRVFLNLFAVRIIKTTFLNLQRSMTVLRIQ
ncbi:hypothetical protein U0035_22310 [Niabella yanshanensis]|uniref:Uncharacterized protein n=1 Tax=Niabella yanshanensis TaxID=577386 RepID=A0ABZ0W8N4_9BACT|nr:hypothetical protein [Niabella yanshanensis]WQD38411.1 hypothetical protein U0035_22310 [Niabella yanshanensis]